MDGEEGLVQLVCRCGLGRLYITAKELLRGRSGDTSEQLQRLLADNGIVCSMGRAGNVWESSAMESVFSSLKTERPNRTIYRTRDVTPCSTTSSASTTRAGGARSWTIFAQRSYRRSLCLA